jgi:hypothetical protein
MILCQVWTNELVEQVRPQKTGHFSIDLSYKTDIFLQSVEMWGFELKYIYMEMLQGNFCNAILNKNAFFQKQRARR